MAKYLLKPSLIVALKEKGIVAADDTMRFRVPYRVQGQRETMHEIVFNVYEAIETDNRIAMRAIEQSHSPKIKINGEWYIADPTVPWFDKLPEEDLTASSIPHSDGDEILTKHDRRLVGKYLRATGLPMPTSWKKVDAGATLAAAASYFSAQ